MTEADVVIETGEGDMGVFTVRPDDGPPAPVVVFLMDAPGKRALLHDMARRIASNGYVVLLPNLYYRTTPAFELDFSSKESFERMVELMSNLGNKAVARDVACAARPRRQTTQLQTPRRVGLVGYCMSGPFAVWSAAEHRTWCAPPRRSTGCGCTSTPTIRPTPGSATSRGELYVGAAEHDDYVPLDMIDRFEAAMQDSGRRRPGRAVLGHPSRVRLRRPAGLRPSSGGPALGGDARPVRTEPAVVTGLIVAADMMSPADLVDYVQRLEALGYESVWIPDMFGREIYVTAGHLLAHTSTIKVGSGIAHVYGRDAIASAQAARTLSELSGGRFIHGLGISHPPAAELRGLDVGTADREDADLPHRTAAPRWPAGSSTRRPTHRRPRSTSPHTARR